MIRDIIKDCILILIAVAIIMGMVSYVFTKKELHFFINKNSELEESNKKYEIEKQKQKMIAQTIIVCYRLSIWEARYYAQTFNEFSVQYTIPWEIYAATAYIESRFRADVLSVKKAKGVMQVIESTAAPVAEKIGIRFIKEQSLWNELLNVPIGCTYLSDMIKDKGFDGGIKSYIGGSAFSSSSPEAQISINKYYADVKTEYDKICFIYKGVVAEYLHNDDIDTTYLK